MYSNQITTNAPQFCSNQCLVSIKFTTWSVAIDEAHVASNCGCGLRTTVDGNARNLKRSHQLCVSEAATREQQR